MIDPSLEVANSSTAEEKLGYWPSYQDISPFCRKTYLQWLSSGKSASDVEIGYVFLYFYGLERRLLVDRPSASEETLLVAEVSRLRSVYAGNRSFDGYSRGLLEAAETLRLLGDAAAIGAFQPDLARAAGAMPLPLKVAIASKIAADRPLEFELAAAGVIGLSRDGAPGGLLVLEHARTAFLQVLRARFEKVFPGGFRIKSRKDSHMRLDYRAATAGLQVDLTTLVKGVSLPDPATLTWTKLANLATQVSNELEPYAKTLAYHPERAASLAALATCPVELVQSTAVEARAWIDTLPGPTATVRFADLAWHAIGAKGAKWTLRHHRAVADALANVGRGMEPDPADGSEHIDDGIEVQVIADPVSLLPRSPSFGVAAAAAVMVAGVARASDRGAVVEEAWLEQVRLRLELPKGDLLRLQAKLRWLRGSSAGLAKAKRLLVGASPADRETVAWSAAVAAAAGGLIDKPQVAMLEAVYDKLEVPRQSLYRTIHSAAAAVAIPASDPVTVTVDAPATLYPIPRPPQPETSGLDEERLRQVRRETERVSMVLAEIFVEEEEAMPPQPTTEEASAQVFSGLDPAHTALVKKLITRSSWGRSDFEAAAQEAGLMPDGSLETINEWAFERFDEPLLEDGDTLTVNISMLEPMADAAQSVSMASVQPMTGASA